MPILTKSKYMAGLSCPRYLWMMFYDLDKIPKLDLATEYIIQQGHIIGQLAKKLFPGGIDLPEESKDFKLNIQKAQELIKQRKTIFEAGIISGELYARADVLLPVNKDEWDVIEVKASTKVKEEHIHDLSFQKHVYQLSGLKIRKCFLLHINRDYVKSGEIEPKDILMQEDITSAVDGAIVGIQERIDNMMNIINNKEAPDVSIRNGCNNGLKCVSEDCWSFLPEGHIFELYRGGKKSLELLEAEILSLKDIPDDFKLNAKQKIQKECEITGKPYINKEGIKSFLDTLHYPLYYLDFETFSTAIPMFDGLKPYSQVCFQFSLHVVEKEGGEPKHYEFLYSGDSDPRKEFVVALKKVLGETGSVVVYNQSFEITRLKELAEFLPEYKKWVESVLVRVVDLWPPFRNFSYYNPKQQGSASIKYILPALCGKDYSGMEIADGGTASAEFYNMAYKNGKDVREALLKYCCLDTMAEVWIVDGLKELVR